MLRKLNLNKLRDLIIYPFYECNLRCEGCKVRKPAGEVGFLVSPYDAFENHITYEHIERVREWNAKYVTILGGEPFLSVNLPEMLNALRESNSKTVVYTNATLLVKEDIKNLKHVLELIDFLTISVEGGAFWTARVRGKGVFEMCMEALNKIQDFTKPVIRMSYWDEIICEECSSPLTNTSFCIHCGGEPIIRDQLTDTIKMIDTFNEQGIPVEVAPRFGSVVEEKKRERKEVKKSVSFSPPSTKRARWFYAALSSCKMADCLLPSYKNYIGLKVTCPAGWSRLTINPEGYITGCQWGNDYFAHVEMDDDLIIKQSEKYVARHSRIMPVCYGCEHMDVCRSSCKVVADYVYCPVRKYSLTKTDDAVRIDDEVRPLSSIKAIKNLKALRDIAPGIC